MSFHLNDYARISTGLLRLVIYYTSPFVCVCNYLPFHFFYRYSYYLFLYSFRLAFLAISMAYLYYRVETFKNVEFHKPRTCDEQLWEVLEDLRRLSKLSSETQGLVDRVSTAYSAKAKSMSPSLV